MSDAALRELERDALADPSAVARLLIARVRIGEIEEQDLVLAAHLEHEPAQLAIGVPSWSPSLWRPSSTAALNLITADELASAVEELQRFGREVLVRAALVAAELAGPHAIKHGVAVERTYRDLMDATRAWITCPCHDHVSAAQRLNWGPATWPTRGIGLAAKFASAVVTEPIDDAAHSAALAVGLAVEAVGMITTVPVSPVRDAIRRELLSGALKDNGPADLGEPMSSHHADPSPATPLDSDRARASAARSRAPSASPVRAWP